MKICFFTSGVFPVNNKQVKAIEHWTAELAEELTKRGHKVHIFGEKSSIGDFILRKPSFDYSYASLIDKSKSEAYIDIFFTECLEYAEKNDIDIIHDQTSNVGVLTLAKYSKKPVVTTLHVTRDNPDYKILYGNLDYTYNIAPSEFVKNASFLKINQIIHHGLKIDNFKYNDIPEDHFVSIGRIIESKGQLDAIKAALIANKKLKIGGYPIDSAESKAYFDKVISETDANRDHIEYIGRVEKQNIPLTMGSAKGFLMPILDSEAFGLVMIEAMASGTPVIAYDSGPVREIVEDGVTGFVVPKGDINALSQAMKNIESIDRKLCRQKVEEKFGFVKMVDQYENIYKELINNHGRNN